MNCNGNTTYPDNLYDFSTLDEYFEAVDAVMAKIPRALVPAVLEHIVDNYSPAWDFYMPDVPITTKIEDEDDESKSDGWV